MFFRMDNLKTFALRFSVQQNIDMESGTCFVFLSFVSFIMTFEGNHEHLQRVTLFCPFCARSLEDFKTVLYGSPQLYNLNVNLILQMQATWMGFWMVKFGYLLYKYRILLVSLSQALTAVVIVLSTCGRNWIQKHNLVIQKMF